LVNTFPWDSSLVKVSGLSSASSMVCFDGSTGIWITRSRLAFLGLQSPLLKERSPIS
jgi:hypothetical protein